MAQPEYPKIIRRPAKPPEEYAYLDVSIKIYLLNNTAGFPI